MVEPLFKRLPLDNRLTPPNPIALKCSWRVRVHELVLPSLLSGIKQGEKERKRDRDGERERERIELARTARLGREGTGEFIEVSLILRG